jgi:hypothetical protein
MALVTAWELKEGIDRTTTLYSGDCARAALLTWIAPRREDIVRALSAAVLEAHATQNRFQLRRMKQLLRAVQRDTYRAASTEVLERVWDAASDCVTDEPATPTRRCHTQLGTAVVVEVVAPDDAWTGEPPSFDEPLGWSDNEEELARRAAK